MTRPIHTRLYRKVHLLLLALLTLLPFAAAQVVQLAGVESAVVLQAQRDVAGVDLVGKDGPLARLGFDLALLYRNFEMEGSTAAVEAVNPTLRVASGFVVVDFVAQGSAQALRADLEALGLENGATFGRYVSGRLPIAAIPAAAALATLHHGRASAAALNVGLVDSQGDIAMRADVARTTFSLNGTGITIGTLSDSYDCLGGAATDVTNGDLPAGINVLADETGCASGSDEGRAMMQLIADVVPGADQQFHTAFIGFADFAQGILDLEAAGSDVIVDDVIYFNEAMFQDDIIAQAVDTVVAAGVPYFSSAGNNARQSYEDTFRNSGTCPAPILLSGTCDAHDFDPGGGVDTLQSIVIPNNASVTFSFQWDQPFFSISGAPGSANDMDIYLLDSAGTTILAASFDSNLGGDAVELMNYTNTSGSAMTVNVVIVKYTDLVSPGPDPSRIKYSLFGGGGVTFNEFDTDSATSFGHANAAGAASVAAACYCDTPEFGTDPPLLESFSSGGGVEILFDTAGNPINDLRAKPEFTAPDGTNTTFFGSDFEPDGFPNFFGTSAAAPHAAAVAALMLENNASLTPTEIYDALAASAIDMGPAGFDNDSGAGLIQADTAIVAALQAGTLSFSAATYTVDEDAGTATINVTRTGGSDGAVSVDYATSDGSATAGSDYTAASGTLNWGDGDPASKSFTVTINDDGDPENNETIALSLSNPGGGAALGTDSATLTIAANDMPGTLAFSAASYTIAEDGGTATITVTRTGGDDGAVSVDYDTSDGSATAGSDYTAASGTLNWGNGDTASKTFAVTIVDDADEEGAETISLSLSNPTGGAALGVASATLTIESNDPASADLALAKGANSPAATVTASPGDEVAVLQVDAAVPAGSDTVTLEGATVQAALIASTGVDLQATLADIVAVNIYLDADADGVVDAGETLLGSAAPDGSSGEAVIDFGSEAPVMTAGSGSTLLVSYEIANTLSRTHGGALALLLAPLGLGLAVRLRRRRLIPLVLLLALLLTACPAPPGVGPQPRSFSTSLTAVTASAATPALSVDVTGLPLAGSTVTVSP